MALWKGVPAGLPEQVEVVVIAEPDVQGPDARTADLHEGLPRLLEGGEGVCQGSHDLGGGLELEGDRADVGEGALRAHYEAIEVVACLVVNDEIVSGLDDCAIGHHDLHVADEVARGPVLHGADADPVHGYPAAQGG